MTDDLSRRPQVPGTLRRFDDPWGITWRVVNLVRRFDLRWNLRLGGFLLRPAKIKRPIFVLGAPRSGTTLLFHLLRSGHGLGSLPGEGHNLWRAYHHPRYSRWRSDAVGPGELGLGEKRFVQAYLRAWIGPKARLVEKTPENSLRIPYLLDLFPDARFVVIHRYPLDVLHSLINGWRHPEARYRSYYVPEDLHIPGHSHRRLWCFALVEGWRQLKSSPVPEIALAQWRACADGLLAGRAAMDPERFTELHLEELLAAPEPTAQALFERLELPWGNAPRQRLEELLERPVNALSPPETEKWRRNSEEILPLVPRMVETAAELGYRIDPATGDGGLQP